jgi:ParB family chromosome partitioning protein
MKKTGLGKGLSALIPEKKGEVHEGPSAADIDRLLPNRFQPRKSFRDEELKSLADSIKAQGILQPIVVRKSGPGFEIVFGERRWRAAKLAGLKQVPVIVREADDRAMHEMALVENLQRSDLNPIEEATAYKGLMEKFDLSQEDVAKRVGKDRSTVANLLRLLKLCREVRDALSEGVITEGHGRAIASLEDENLQRATLRKIIGFGLSVRETEKLAKELSAGRKPKKSRHLHQELVQLEEDLKRKFATKVAIRGTKSKGRIFLEYYSAEELDRLLDMLLS